jgi:hypothetical protein
MHAQHIADDTMGGRTGWHLSSELSPLTVSIMAGPRFGSSPGAILPSINEYRTVEMAFVDSNTGQLTPIRDLPDVHVLLAPYLTTPDDPADTVAAHVPLAIAERVAADVLGVEYPLRHLSDTSTSAARNRTLITDACCCIGASSVDEAIFRGYPAFTDARAQFEINAIGVAADCGPAFVYECIADWYTTRAIEEAANPGFAEHLARQSAIYFTAAVEALW